ncbi:MAG: hypothetical protein D6731_14440, partial [Planctomycetota bacterium]
AVAALGFGTTVATWAVAYVGRLPAVQASPKLLLFAFALCLLAGGALAGHWLPTRNPLWAGGLAGALSCALDLLILGSVLADGAGQATTWIPGTIALGAVLGSAGSLIARALAPRTAQTRRNWPAHFSWVALGATLLLLAVGGIVTGAEAGLAVPDWPNTYASNMFLYPLSRMTGDVYYEHAHRLFGSLVGLTTLALAVVAGSADRRRWFRGILGLAFGLVCLQGLLGGLRVTGRLTLSTDRAQLAPSLFLALVHGIHGQLFFGLLAVIASAASTTWRRAERRPLGEHAASTLATANWFLGIAALQLVLGAVVRHYHTGTTWHVACAVLLVVVSGAAGVRARSAHADLPVLPRLGTAILAVVTLQFLLGVGALATTADPESALARWQVGVTTAHQTCGASLLALAAAYWAWSRRLLSSAAPSTDEAVEARAGAAA